MTNMISTPYTDAEVGFGLDKQKNAIHTPNWLVRFEGLTASNHGFDDKAVQLFRWFAESERTTTGASAHDLKADGSMRHTNVEVTIPIGPYSPSMELYMNQGKKVPKIIIDRMGNLNQENLVMQEIEYDDCTIERINQQGDLMNISFRFTKRIHSVFVYDQYTGQKQGQTVSTTDYGKSITDG